MKTMGLLRKRQDWSKLELWNLARFNLPCVTTILASRIRQTPISYRQGASLYYQWLESKAGSNKHFPEWHHKQILHSKSSQKEEITKATVVLHICFQTLVWFFLLFEWPRQTRFCELKTFYRIKDFQSAQGLYINYYFLFKRHCVGLISRNNYFEVLNSNICKCTVLYYITLERTVNVDRKIFRRRRWEINAINQTKQFFFKILKACWAENSVITKLLKICVQWTEFNFVLTDCKCCQQLNDGL